MGRHRGCCQLWLAGGERSQQATMRNDGDSTGLERQFLFRAVGQGETHLKLPSDTLPECEQALIAASLHHIFMQLNIKTAELGERGGSCFRCDVIFDPGRVGRRPKGRCPPGTHALQSPAGLYNFIKIRLIEGADTGSAIGSELHQSFPLQRNEGLADWSPAQGKSFRQHRL